jgi:hypothetical protein
MPSVRKAASTPACIGAVGPKEHVLSQPRLYADPEVMRGVALFVEVARHLAEFAEVTAVVGGQSVKLKTKTCLSTIAPGAPRGEKLWDFN